MYNYFIMELARANLLKLLPKENIGKGQITAAETGVHCSIIGDHKHGLCDCDKKPSIALCLAPPPDKMVNPGRAKRCAYHQQHMASPSTKENY